MRWIFFTIFIPLIAGKALFGQVSQGGAPLEIPRLKSEEIPVVIMPALNREALQVTNAKLQPGSRSSKPFRFAVGFDVKISPESHGVWTSNVNGYDVWQVRIRSEGAFSLSLIFEAFHLPAGSRLFLYNEQEGHCLGAFTAFNNKSSGKLAVSPVAGDEVTVHFELPAGNSRESAFVIAEVSHDYLGILKNERRPMKITAGSCNTDINCPTGEPWKDVKDAVCRIIISKPDLPGKPKEICTGTLINNTAEDQRPFILTAAHCFDKEKYAETAIFTFNYESPFCAPLDGDPANSISGASLLASSDSLDFALVELSVIPPPEYRPYYAGWDHRELLPDSSVSIHHPQGDIKKIAVDRDPPDYSHFLSDYTPGGFFKITLWDEGVTEAGSSGGGLFSPDRHLIGTLTGGVATCAKPIDDYFSRFDMAWEYRPDSSRQLKHWLDPRHENIPYLSGKRFYQEEDLCRAYTNLEYFDEHENVVLKDNEGFAGYWGGTNRIGITAFSERFVIPGGCNLQGLSVGIGKIDLISGEEGELTVHVYNGDDQPQYQLHSESVKMNTLVADAMNYIPFTEAVEPADTFFVGLQWNNLQSRDTFVVYQSLRQPGKENFFWFRQHEKWFNFQASNDEGMSMTSVFELVACNVNGMPIDTSLVHDEMEALVYPNPAHALFTFVAGHDFRPENIRIFNLIGQEADARLLNHHEKKIQIDLAGNVPGIYFVRLKTGRGTITKKVSYNPW